MIRNMDFKSLFFLCSIKLENTFYYLFAELWIHKFLYVFNFLLSLMTDFKRVGLKSLTNITVLYKSSSNRFCFIDLAAICVCACRVLWVIISFLIVCLGYLRSRHQARIKHGRILLGEMPGRGSGRELGNPRRATRSCKSDPQYRRDWGTSRLPEWMISSASLPGNPWDSVVSQESLVSPDNKPTSDPVLWVKVTVWAQPRGQLAYHMWRTALKGRSEGLWSGCSL